MSSYESDYDNWKLDNPWDDGFYADDTTTPLDCRMGTIPGYHWNGSCWMKPLYTRTHTARKAHHGIAVGQRYEVRAWRVVETDRTSHVHCTYTIMESK